MSTLSIEQAGQYASSAGFTGLALATIVAIAQAESGLVTNNRNTNTDGTIDRGILQINSFWHMEVTDAEADDPAQAFVAGWRISAHGTDFTQWTTFRTGAYKKTPAWKASTKTTPPPTITHTWSLEDSKRVWAWLFPMIENYKDPHVFHFNPADGENGTDFGIAQDTIITSLTLGTVLTIGYYGGGGVVCVQSQLPAPLGNAVVYYQHLDVISVTKGEIVHVGDQIGLSGGQLHGGTHPSTRAFSTGPHIEVGINPPAGAGEDGKPLWVTLGANIDPWPFLTTLAQKGPTARDLLAGINPGVAPTGVLASNAVGTVITATDTAITGRGPIGDSFLAIEQGLDGAMQLQPFRFSGTQINNPVAGVPIIGGVVGAIEGPFSSAASVESWLSGLSEWIGVNTMPVLLRMFFMGIGMVILIAFVFSIYSAALKASGVEDVAKTAIAAAPLALGA